MQELKVPVEKDYRKNLVKTVAVLYNIHNQLLGQTANLAISGELSEFNKDLVEKGLSADYKYEDFTSLSDANVQHLIELTTHVKEKMKIILQKTLE